MVTFFVIFVHHWSLTDFTRDLLYLFFIFVMVMFLRFHLNLVGEKPFNQIFTFVIIFAALLVLNYIEKRPFYFLFSFMMLPLLWLCLQLNEQELRNCVFQGRFEIFPQLRWTKLMNADILWFYLSVTCFRGTFPL